MSEVTEIIEEVAVQLDIIDTSGGVIEVIGEDATTIEVVESSTETNDLDITTTSTTVIVESNSSGDTTLDITEDSPTTIEITTSTPTVDIVEKTLISGALELSFANLIDKPLNFNSNTRNIGTTGVDIPLYPLHVSGTAFADNVSSSRILTQDITASGNITSNGLIGGNRFKINDNTFAELGSVNGVDNTLIIGNNEKPINVASLNLNVENPISASIISASGHLFASASSAENITNANNVITYDVNTGQFYYTGSYGGSGGGGISDGSTILTSQITDFEKDINLAFLNNTISNSFDGNRPITNELLTTLEGTNIGTTSSLKEFVEQVFFPNNPPIIEDDETIFSISEFSNIDTIVGTINAIDPENNALTFTTQSTYTAGNFGIHTDGRIFARTKTNKSTNNSSFNNIGVQIFPIKVTDQEKSTLGNVYIHVIPNTTPIFRQGSTSGTPFAGEQSYSIEESITTFTKFFYFTDPQNDTITIETGSGEVNGDSDVFKRDFNLHVSSSFVKLELDSNNEQLDASSIPTYTLALTASDSHYQSGEDLTSINYLPITIALTDNSNPVISNQTITGITESINTSGTSVGTLSYTDPEGDLVTVSNFTLKEVFLGTFDAQGIFTATSGDIKSTLDGTSYDSPAQDPFESVNGSLNITLKSGGPLLNSRVANLYTYDVTIFQNSQPDNTSTAVISIPVTPMRNLTIDFNFPDVAYIIETAISGDKISNWSGGKQNVGSLVGSPNISTIRIRDNNVNYHTAIASITSSGNTIGFNNGTNENNSLSIDGIKVISDILQSSFTSGNIINCIVTAQRSEYPPSITTRNFTINVTNNSAPTFTLNKASSIYTDNHNTNLAITSNKLGIIIIQDAEGDSIDHTSLSFTGNNLQIVRNGSLDSYYIQPSSNNLAANNYPFTFSIDDQYGNTGTISNSITISSATDGTFTTNGTFYVIETAEIGDNIVTNSNGRTGTQASITFSPSSGEGITEEVTFSTQSGTVLTLADGGSNKVLLSLSSDILGNYSNGSTITETITITDQFSRSQSTTISINITNNSAPTGTLTTNTIYENSIVGTKAAGLTVSDTEGDYPITALITNSTAQNQLTISKNNSNGTSWDVDVNSTITSTTSFPLNITIKDKYNNSTNLSDTITVSPPLAEIAPIYIYSWNGFGSGGTEAETLNILRGTHALGAAPGSTTPQSGSVIKHFQVGSLGENSFQPVYSDTEGNYQTVGTVTKIATLNNKTNMLGASGIASAGAIGGGTSARYLFIFADASNLSNKPTSMYDGPAIPAPSNVDGRRYLYAVTSLPGILGTGVHYFNLSTPISGYSRWGMIFLEGKTGDTITYHLKDDTDSAPS